MFNLRGTYVNVIDNETMRSVCKGTLLKYTSWEIVVDSGLRYIAPRVFDAKVHHFEGFEPPMLLIKRKGKYYKKE